ncbi:MAG: HAD family phosphatase [Rhizobiales bacterium]|nr:HAD family phosphatase [Hyphomicrobiales bacterium]
MDGTLVDSEPLHEEALVSALARQGLTPPPDFHDHIVGRDAREVHRWCQHHLGLSLPLRDWLRLKYRVYFATVETLQAREGAVDLFLRLRAAGHPQAVVSNSDRLVVNANLDAAGINDPGLITVSRNDVRDGKPGGEPYLRAAWLLGVEPVDCLVVEDSTTGARAGLAAGMRTLFWPQTDLAAPKGAVAVSSLQDLEAIILDESRP